MRQRLKIPIKNKILKKNNIIEIAEVIVEKCAEVKFNVKFKNEQEIEYNDIGIFQDRRVEEYEIDYITLKGNDSKYKNIIEIYVYNYDIYARSYIEISASDSEWMAIIEKNIAEKISFCDKTSKLNLLFKNDFALITVIEIMVIISTIFCGRLCLKAIDTLEKSKETIFIIISLVFNFVYMDLFRKLEKTFPDVEISINEKNNNAKNKRNIIKMVMCTFIVPIIIDLILGAIKYIINK